MFQGKVIAILACTALCAAFAAKSPAQAGVLDSAQPTISAQTVTDIQHAIDGQRYLDAGRALEQALLIAGDDPRLTFLSGELSLARNRYAEALASFKRVDGNAEFGARAIEGEGIALASLGQSNDAISMLQAAVAKNPQSWRAWNALGCEFDGRHDWQRAEDAYQHALASSGDSALVLNNRGYSRLSQSRLDDAIGDFVAALQKKADLTAARNNLRLAMAMRGDYDRAVAGGNATDRAAMLNNAGFAAMLSGNYGQARDLLDRAMKAKGEYYAVAAANLEMTNNLAASHSQPGKDANASVN